MSRYPQLRSASIPALWAVQRHYGWCSPEGIRQAAAVMGVTPAYLQSVASFYDLFATEPVGRHRVLVCTNISCWMSGGDELLEAFCEATGADAHDASHGGASSPDGEFFVKGFECLGACDIAPMASIDERYYGPLDDADAAAALDALRAGDEPLPEKALAKRRPAAGGPEPDARPAPGGDRRCLRRGCCFATSTTRAGDDRGLPAPRRLQGARARLPRARPGRTCSPPSRTRACAAAAAPASRWARRARFLPRGEMEKYLCCNADESEPGTFKDRELMMKNPHQLIEGVAIAALAVGARYAFIFIRGEYWEIADILDRAVAEAYEAGYLGANILGTGSRGRARRPPRRRRLHLRRGDGAARLARGQARQPAAEAAVPGDPGPLRRADADQQRRDALERAPTSSTTAPTGSRASAPSSRRGPRSSRSRAASSGRATTRSSSGSPRAS